MTRSLRRVVGSTLVVTILVLSSETAKGISYCPFSQGSAWESDIDVIPVYVSDANGGFESAPTNYEIQQAVENQLQELFEQTEAKVLPYFAGNVSGYDEYDFIPGAIVIHPSVQGGPDAFPLDTDQPANGLDTCRIRFPASDAPYGVSSNRTLQHELIHCLGIHHPETCQTPPEEFAMMSNTNFSSYYQNYDIRAVEEAYGLRSNTVFGFDVPSGGGSWSTAPANSGLAHARGALGACNSLSRGAYVAYAHRTADTIYRWIAESGSPQSVGNTWTRTLPGVACGDSTSQWMLSFVSNTAPTTSVPLHWLRTYNGGYSQQPLWRYFRYEDDAADVQRSTYDPATGRYLTVYSMSDPNAVGSYRRLISRVATTSGTVGTEKALVAGAAPVIEDSNLVVTAGRPAVACGNPSVVGSENCIVAWVNAGWDTTLRWVHGHVDPSTNEFVTSSSNIMAQGLQVKGTPSLAYTGDSSKPWLLVFHQAGNWLLSYRKPATITSGWSYSYGVWTPGVTKVVSPATLSYYGWSCSVFCILVFEQRVYTKGAYIP